MRSDDVPNSSRSKGGRPRHDAPDLGFETLANAALVAGFDPDEIALGHVPHEPSYMVGLVRRDFLVWTHVSDFELIELGRRQLCARRVVDHLAAALERSGR